MSRSIKNGAGAPRSASPFLVARLVVGGAFLYLAWQKLFVHDPTDFLKALREYGIIGDDRPWLLNSAAAVIPWVELSLGVLILLGVGIRGAALVALALLFAFTGALLLRAREIQAAEGLGLCQVAFDCGCGTGVENMCRKLPENLVLILCSLWLLLSRSERFCLLPRLVRS